MMFRSHSNTSKSFLRDYVTIAMVIVLETMTTPISSLVKDKNSIFTARDEDMNFLVKQKVLVFHWCLYNKRQLRIGPCLACVYRVMDAHGKFGEHERSVRLARGDRREQL